MADPTDDPASPPPEPSPFTPPEASPSPPPMPVEAEPPASTDPTPSVAKAPPVTLGRSVTTQKPTVKKDEDTGSSLRTLLAAVFVAVASRYVLYEAFLIDGPSMEPTFLDGDRVVVAKWPLGIFLPFTHEALFSWGMPEVGDVVIVHSPADNEDIVKRVIGVPGDRVEVRGDMVYRNGEPIRIRDLGVCPESETTDPSETCHQFEEGANGRTWRVSFNTLEAEHGYRLRSLSEREVPPGHIFIMGDHRDHSHDSRDADIGMVPIERVKGRADAIFWSSDEGIRWSRMFQAVR